MKVPLPHFLAVAAVALTSATACGAAQEDEPERARSFRLENGMQIVVIEDRRAPIVTHVLTYRVGAGDEPAGASGTAHYLEHMMFKSAGQLKAGDYTRSIAVLGGSTNALTTHDATTYYARVPREELERLMAMETERMSRLDIAEPEFAAERSVILAERRGRIDADPFNVLSEQVTSVLYANHPYGRPSIGWQHEIASLKRDTVKAFYDRFYGPANATAVVVGDITVNDVMAAAQKTYGRVWDDTKMAPPPRAKEAASVVHRRVEWHRPEASAPKLYRVYSVPSYTTGQAREALSLEVLGVVLAQRGAGRLHSRLIEGQQIAVKADGGYAGVQRDDGQLALLLMGAEGVNPQRLEDGLDEVVAEISNNGVSIDEIETARGLLEARRIFASDSQLQLARLYADYLAVGLTTRDVEQWIERLREVTPDDVQLVARRYLVPERAVTGHMLPPDQNKKAAAVAGSEK